MPRFAANLSLLFTEVPFLDRFARARAAGFDAVEFQFPYAWPAREIRARLDDAGLTAVLHNLPPGDWDAGERGLAGLPGREAEFRDSVAIGVDCATTLGVPRLHCMLGLRPMALPDAQWRDTVLANLRFAAQAFADAGLELLLEPLNDYDTPGYSLTTSAQAISLLDELGAPNAKLQYDVYHMQRMEGEIAATIERLLPRIGHVQVADNPGRHEPGTGELNWRFLFAHLDGLGYAGHVGCEYRPRAGTEEGLGWMHTLLTG